VASAYVLNTGVVIARLFREQNLDPVAVPGVLVAGHAPFAWGKTPTAAVEHADLLEYIARLAYRTVVLEGPTAGLAKYVGEHHYQRKHGPKATYGQKTGNKH
jgi:L-ribulose-5-phosphate 4-epimerase